MAHDHIRASSLSDTTVVAIERPPYGRPTIPQTRPTAMLASAQRRSKSCFQSGRAPAPTAIAGNASSADCLIFRRIEAAAIELHAQELVARTNVDEFEYSLFGFRVDGLPHLLQKRRLRAVHDEKGVDLAIALFVEGRCRSIRLDVDDLLPFRRVGEDVAERQLAARP